MNVFQFLQHHLVAIEIVQLLSRGLSGSYKKLVSSRFAKSHKVCVYFFFRTQGGRE